MADAVGTLAGGQLSGQMTLHSAEDGLTARARISVTGANASELSSATTRPPVSGFVGLTAELDGTGLSPVALIGSLKGSGRIVLTDGKIGDLDPRTFDVVVRAIDQGGTPIESGRISDLVNKSLESGPRYLSSAARPRSTSQPASFGSTNPLSRARAGAFGDRYLRPDGRFD